MCVGIGNQLRLLEAPVEILHLRRKISPLFAHKTSECIIKSDKCTSFAAQCIETAADEPFIVYGPEKWLTNRSLRGIGASLISWHRRFLLCSNFPCRAAAEVTSEYVSSGIDGLTPRDIGSMAHPRVLDSPPILLNKNGNKIHLHLIGRN